MLIEVVIRKYFGNQTRRYAKEYTINGFRVSFGAFLLKAKPYGYIFFSTSFNTPAHYLAMHLLKIFGDWSIRAILRQIFRGKFHLPPPNPTPPARTHFYAYAFTLGSH